MKAAKAPAGGGGAGDVGAVAAPTSWIRITSASRMTTGDGASGATGGFVALVRSRACRPSVRGEAYGESATPSAATDE